MALGGAVPTSYPDLMTDTFIETAVARIIA